MNKKSKKSEDTKVNSEFNTLVVSQKYLREMSMKYAAFGKSIQTEAELGRQLSDVALQYSSSLLALKSEFNDTTEMENFSNALIAYHEFFLKLQDSLVGISSKIDTRFVKPISVLTEKNLDNAKASKSAYERAQENYKTLLKQTNKTEDVSALCVLEDTEKSTLAALKSSSEAMKLTATSLFTESHRMYSDYFRRGLELCKEFEERSKEITMSFSKAKVEKKMTEPNKKRYPVRNKLFHIINDEYEYIDNLERLLYHLNNLISLNSDFDSLYKKYSENLSAFNYYNMNAASSSIEYFFVYINEIYSIHSKDFVIALESAYEVENSIESVKIVTEALNRIVPQMQNFYKYNVNSLSESAISLNRMRSENKIFDAAIKNSELSSMGKGISIEKLLYCPQKYLFALQTHLLEFFECSRTERLKSNVRIPLADSLNTFNEMITEVDEAKSDSERKSILLLIGQKLKGYHDILAEDHRILVNEIDCILMKDKKVPIQGTLTHYLFLFNDCLIIAEKTKNMLGADQKLKFCMQVPLSTLRVEKGNDSDVFFSFVLIWEEMSKHAKTFVDQKNETKSVTIAVSSKGQCDSWIGYINSAIKNVSESSVFGVDLVQLMCTRPNEKNRRIPLFVARCVTYLLSNGLNIEGIFRISGHAKTMMQMRSKTDLGIDVVLDDAHVAAGLLKNYLRELPNSLLTYELYDEWITAVSTDDEKTVKNIQALLKKLPQAHRDLLHVLVDLFARVVANVAETKMQCKNMSIVIAPNIIYPPLSESNKDSIGSDSFSNVSSQYVVVEKMISLKDSIFTDPLPPLDCPKTRTNFALVKVDLDDDDLPEIVLDEEGNVISSGPTKADLLKEGMMKEAEEKKKEQLEKVETEMKAKQEEKKKIHEQKKAEKEKKKEEQRKLEEAKQKEIQELELAEKKAAEERAERKRKLEEELKNDAKEEVDDEDEEFMCGGCGKEIGEDEDGLSAMGKAWHRKCFVCSKCGAALSGKFIQRDGKPICNKCK